MTRKLLSAAAVMVAVFFTGSLVAQAADVTFGGQLRPRYEVRQQSDANQNGEFITMRTRLNTNVKVDDNTSAFLQFQMNSTWGGGGFNPSAASDASTEVGLHQAYFTLKNLFGAPVTAKIGRQEIILDGHRLFGNTGWTSGSQSHDAAVFTHSHDNMTLLYGWSKVFEAPDAFDETNVEAHIGWLNMKGLMGGNSSTSVYLVYIDNDSAHPALGQVQFWTIGARHAGGSGAIDYRGEFYFQSGESGGTGAGGIDQDISAFMFGGRVGYKAAGVGMKPKITLWADYLSGSDTTTTDFEAFNTLFDTGHKFYGLQDIILSQGVVGGNHAGLLDIAVKLAMHPTAKITAKADFHHFQTAEDKLSGAVPTLNDDLGQEIDLTLIYKYSANVKWSTGVSVFFNDDNFPINASTEDPSWFYIMADLKF